MINPIEIVWCYVSKTIPFSGEIEALRNSFLENGFSEKEITLNKWKYTRGASLGLDFKYSKSEAMQVQVVVEFSNGELNISVGNWGFPFEPLLMKKRFIRTLERISNEVSNNGQLLVDHAEAG